MKIEQQVGGAKPNQDAYTGEERQLTVDTDNWDLRLHDGATPGGHIILSKDNSDLLYQAADPELDGISSFAPELRGFLTRVGAGQYRIRKITFNADQLTVQYPEGYSGNPAISINTRIETDHIFGGDIIIEGILQVDGGINANLSGDVTGNLTGNVTGNVTGNLTGNADGDHTGSFTGDVDVSAGTLTLADGQILPVKINGLEAYVKLHAVPMGVILMWSGEVVDIPAGWYLCNGLNGTPDLRDKFILGAGSLDYAPGDSGGTTTHTHVGTIANGGSHSHTVTVDGHALTVNELPVHDHPNGVTDQQTNEIFCEGHTAATIAGYDLWGYDAGSGVFQGLTGDTGGGLPHSHTAATASGGTHTHLVDNDDTTVLPPYYALCFIMRAP